MRHYHTCSDFSISSTSILTYGFVLMSFKSSRKPVNIAVNNSCASPCRCSLMLGAYWCITSCYKALYYLSITKLVRDLQMFRLDNFFTAITHITKKKGKCFSQFTKQAITINNFLYQTEMTATLYNNIF